MNEKGFSLLEVIAAIFVLTIGIVGSYIVLSYFAVTTSLASSRLTAAYLAQEGIEIVRNIRDNNWLNNLNWKDSLENCEFGCEMDYKTKTEDGGEPISYNEPGNFLKIDSDNFYSYSGETATKFKRKITITFPAEDILLVSAEVFWEERGKPYNFTTEEYLYNWYK